MKKKKCTCSLKRKEEISKFGHFFDTNTCDFCLNKIFTSSHISEPDLNQWNTYGISPVYNCLSKEIR